MRRLLAAVGLLLLVLVLGAAPASAHAELRATDPPGGGVLDTAPERVVLRFTEPVELSFGSVRVFTEEGQRVDTGSAAHADGRRDAVAVTVAGDRMGRGSFVVAWRVLSADSHPVQGAFTFRVGDAVAGGDTDAFVRRLLADQGGSAAVGAAYGVARFAVLGGLLLLVGSSAFVLALWPAGRDDKRARRLVAGAWAATFVGTVAAIGLQGAYAAGLGLGDALRPSVVSSVLDTRYGVVAVTRLALLAVAAVLVRRSRTLVRDRRTRTVGVVLAAGLLVTPGLAGHPGAGEAAWFTTAVDVVHLAAAAVWLGGLAMVVVAAVDDEGVVRRFSSVAFVAVIVIAATGLVQSWRQVGSLDALRHTTYGNLLVAKVALFVGMVALAAWSRRWLRRGAGDSLRRSVAGEAAVGVAVVVLTALLVNVVPARNALAQPFSATVEAGNLFVDVTVDPAKAGPVELHVYVLAASGAVTEVAELTAQLSLPAESIGPLRVPLERVAPGHYAAYRFDVPLAGRWRLDVVARTGDVDQVRGTTTVRIR